MVVINHHIHKYDIVFAHSATVSYYLQCSIYHDVCVSFLVAITRQFSSVIFIPIHLFLYNNFTIIMVFLCKSLPNSVSVMCCVGQFSCSNVFVNYFITNFSVSCSNCGVTVKYLSKLCFWSLLLSAIHLILNVLQHLLIILSCSFL